MINNTNRKKNNKWQYITVKLLLCFAFLTTITSCKKFVDVQPPGTQLGGSEVYNSNGTASAAVTGIFQAMINGTTIGGGPGGFSALLGLSADEFSLYPTSDLILNPVYSNSISSITGIPIWQDLYSFIYQSNLAIEGLTKANNVSTSLKNQLIGEAKFIRAFSYFYLVNIFGDVPLATTSDYSVNSLLKRSTASSVNDQILKDLDDAISLLSDGYMTPSGSTTTARVLPNRQAAIALLARVYLFLEKWQQAETQASIVINDNKYALVTDLSKVFLTAGNKEAIWQLETPSNSPNAADGRFLSGYFYSGGPTNSDPFLLSDSLVKSFEPGDLRKLKWTVSIGNYFFPYKYKLYPTGQPPVENATLLRLSEMYLIRAESRARLQNLTGAINDLNTIRNRAALNNTSATSQSDILNAILNERRVELFTEDGHRWLDLKRTGKIDSVMSAYAPMKGSSWASTDRLYPIPFRELRVNPNLSQNDGYN